MSRINANDLTTNDIAAIEEAPSKASQAVISIRGKDAYVVMGLARYRELLEHELEVALAETRADLAAWRMFKESPELHLARVDALDTPP